MSKKDKSNSVENPLNGSGEAPTTKVIGAYDAKTRLPEILRQVSEGQSFTVTNRGHAVAEITPVYAAQTKRTKTAINNILNMEKSIVSDQTLTELKHAGRK